MGFGEQVPAASPLRTTTDTCLNATTQLIPELNERVGVRLNLAFMCNEMVDQNSASWTRIAYWLGHVEGLQQAT
jgi:hypothetical protein